jgi:hypothetical protein
MSSTRAAFRGQKMDQNWFLIPLHLGWSFSRSNYEPRSSFSSSDCNPLSFLNRVVAFVWFLPLFPTQINFFIQK